MIRFQTVCSLTAALCVVLFAIFLVAPTAYTAGYGVGPDTGGTFLGQRTAPLFLGLAAICWLLRKDTARQVREAVSVAVMVTFLGIAATGVWAFWQGVADQIILLAAIGEVCVALAFALALRRPD